MLPVFEQQLGRTSSEHVEMDFMTLFGTVIAVLFHPGSASKINGKNLLRGRQKRQKRVSLIFKDLHMKNGFFKRKKKIEQVSTFSDTEVNETFFGVYLSGAGKRVLKAAPLLKKSKASSSLRVS